jgi:perosamine synthetase
MPEDFIMQMRPCFGEEEKQAICEYMSEDGFITEFERTEKFEQMLAKYIGAKHCIVVNNGTVSLTLAAMAVGIKADDEVIVPNYTMIATPNSLKLFGAKPIFVDVEEETLCLDIEQVKKTISTKTKAIILVSANGRYPNSGISAFEQLCEERGLILIEDSAQSLGSFYPDERHIGTAGLVGIFSFSTPKIISTGQGGAIVTNNDNVAKKLRKLKDFGRTSGGNDIHDSIGFNFKFTELQACIGIAQMEKLSSRVQRKKDIYKQYQSELKGIKEISFFKQDLLSTTPWFIDIVVERRRALQNYLKEKNIGTRVMYPPIHSQAAYGLKGHYPVSNHVGKNGLWLPSMVQLTKNQISRITVGIRKFYC